MNRKNLKIKVCGMRDSDDIRRAAEQGVDYIGMIFCDKSPRNVTMIPTHAGIIPDRSSLPSQSSDLHPCVPSAASEQSANAPVTRHTSPKHLGLFVDEMPQNIITRVVNFKLDVVQMHGNEPATVIRNLRATLDPDIRPGIQFWKTIAVSSISDLDICKEYENCVDAFVIDAKSQSIVDYGVHLGWSILDIDYGDKLERFYLQYSSRSL